MKRSALVMGLAGVDGVLRVHPLALLLPLLLPLTVDLLLGAGLAAGLALLHQSTLLARWPRLVHLGDQLAIAFLLAMALGEVLKTGGIML